MCSLIVCVICFAYQNYLIATISSVVFAAFFVFLVVYLKSPKHKGVVGERQVGRVLQRIANKRDGFVVNDIIIPDLKMDGKTSQIDHIILTKDFIAAIETKNWSGYIYGREEDREWTQVLAQGHVKNHLYNPLKQNFTHTCRLVDFLDFRKGVIDSYICFPKANIKNVASDKVFNLRGLKKYLLSISTNKFTRTEIKECYDLLRELKDNPIQSNRQHVKEIHKMQKDVEKGICPRCGGKLVLRTNSKGQQFYGCSNYPKCKFIKKY